MLKIHEFSFLEERKSQKTNKQASLITIRVVYQLLLWKFIIKGKELSVYPAHPVYTEVHSNQIAPKDTENFFTEKCQLIQKNVS